jgi:mono/diheme cytochrome c family protein
MVFAVLLKTNNRKIKLLVMKFYIPLFVIMAGLVISCGGQKNETASDVAEERSTVDGAEVYKKNCTVCHGEDGKLGVNGSKDLTVSTLTLNERMAIIQNGKGLMTAFGEILSLEEVHAVASYTMELK